MPKSERVECDCAAGSYRSQSDSISSSILLELKNENQGRCKTRENKFSAQRVGLCWHRWQDTRGEGRYTWGALWLAHDPNAILVTRLLSAASPTEPPAEIRAPAAATAANNHHHHQRSLFDPGSHQTMVMTAPKQHNRTNLVNHHPVGPPASEWQNWIQSKRLLFHSLRRDVQWLHL